MDRLSDLESHLATLGALPNLAQASDFLSALSISDRMLQVVEGPRLQYFSQASVQTDFVLWALQKPCAAAVVTCGRSMKVTVNLLGNAWLQS